MAKPPPLPCPFCGAPPEVRPKNPEKEGDGWGAVACVNPKCPAQPNVRDGLVLAVSSAACKQAAIRRWNRRAPAHG